MFILKFFLLENNQLLIFFFFFALFGNIHVILFCIHIQSVKTSKILVIHKSLTNILLYHYCYYEITTLDTLSNIFRLPAILQVCLYRMYQWDNLFLWICVWNKMHDNKNINHWLALFYRCIIIAGIMNGNLVIVFNIHVRIFKRFKKNYVKDFFPIIYVSTLFSQIVFYRFYFQHLSTLKYYTFISCL